MRKRGRGRPGSRLALDPRLSALDSSLDSDAAIELKKRTLTSLYNKRPTWLDLAHQKLDAAVFAAYGWETGISDDELLARLLELNLKRAGEQQ